MKAQSKVDFGFRIHQSSRKSAKVVPLNQGVWRVEASCPLAGEPEVEGVRRNWKFATAQS